MQAAASREEEYFSQQELIKKMRLAEERRKALAATEQKRLKELHHMRCPKCGMELVEIDYKGMKLDECSACKGVWLDSKELDAIVKMEQSSLTKLLSVFNR